MTDIMTPQQRHYCMSRIRGKDTKPELQVRKWLWHHGYRYRLNVKSVPGKPDIVMRKYRTAIFVNGCFWHGHNTMRNEQQLADSRKQIALRNEAMGMRNDLYLEQPRRDKTEARSSESPKIQSSECCKIPHSNVEFWVNKITRNMERDQKNYQLLHDNGWQVIVLWECQLKSKLLEETMQRVEVQLNDYFIRSLGPKSKKYIHYNEKDIPMAAEDMEEYITRP